jgi:hypothetical protein
MSLLRPLSFKTVSILSNPKFWITCLMVVICGLIYFDDYGATNPLFRGILSDPDNVYLYYILFAVPLIFTTFALGSRGTLYTSIALTIIVFIRLLNNHPVPWLPVLFPGYVPLIGLTAVIFCFEREHHHKEKTTLDLLAAVQDKLRESESFNASLLDNAPNPILVSGFDSSIIHIC